MIFRKRVKDKQILVGADFAVETGELFCDTLRSANSRYISGEMMSTAMYYKYMLSPNIPKDFLCFEMRIPLMCDSIYLKCERKYGRLNFFADIPFSMNVSLNVGGNKCKLSHGFNAVNL